MPPVAKTKLVFAVVAEYTDGFWMKKDKTKSSARSAPAAARNPKKSGDMKNIV